ncbi:MAG: FixH family protein [Gammaproteobacteria bacterium]|nr:FixH family protein [Gammaproteobacteria bacterium]MBU1415093.1 FixH family protein [Gammaproteobacteria bacterium]
MTTINTVKPWYKERWPWYLAAGPFIVVVASAITAWLAASSTDGLVTDDYYKEGLAVEKTLARSRLAASLGLEIRARFTADGVSLGLRALNSDASFTPPSSLLLTLSHPTRAGMDQQVPLTVSGEDYVGKFRLPASGHWLVLVEDDARSWRIMGNVVLPALGDVVIGGASGKEGS